MLQSNIYKFSVTFQSPKTNEAVEYIFKRERMHNHFLNDCPNQKHLPI